MDRLHILSAVIPIYVCAFCFGMVLSDTCKAKREFKIQSPALWSPGTTIAQYGPVNQKACERACRQYLDCQGYLITWIDESLGLGHCRILNGFSDDGSYTPSPNESLFGYCPDMFFNTGGRCYLAISQNENQADAHQVCLDSNPRAHLMEVPTSAEKSTLIHVAEQEGLTHVWVSAVKDDGGTFRWSSSGEAIPLTDEEWGEQQPNGEDCVIYVIASDWEMHDAPCANEYTFICEI